MENLIPIISKLQDVFHAIGESPVDLPQIVVIGSQSSGKSSVLESIVGRGICTRRPLVLQLQNTTHSKNAPSFDSESEPLIDKENVRPASEESSKTKEDSKVWGEFLHVRGRKFTDFNDIRDEIAKETARGAGSDRGINETPIRLKIFSPNVLDLTMVDLPGITKVAVGDQPQDIEDRVRRMCLKYTTNPRSIILAVTAANTDIANSDSLKMAREVDPEGKRTLGVLTKLDLMDRGTDALDALAGRIIPLQLGYVGVVNRCQSDVEKGVSIKEARRLEANFFATHKSYRLMSSRLGTTYLTRRLNQTLVDHIKRCLPDIKMRISKMLLRVNSELESIGNSTRAMDRSEQGRVLLSILAQFSTSFADAIEGRSTTHENMLSELYGGARISYIFNEIFSKSVSNLDPFTGLTDADIRNAIRNATGPRPALFVPEVSFETLVRRQIAGLTQAGAQCVEMVYEELRRLTTLCDCPQLQQYQDLTARVVDTVHHLLKQRLGPTQQMVSNLIELELSYINTSHPDFIGGSRAVANIMARMKSEDEAGRYTGSTVPPRQSTSKTTTSSSNVKKRPPGIPGAGRMPDMSESSSAPPVTNDNSFGSLNMFQQRRPGAVMMMKGRNQRRTSAPAFSVRSDLLSEIRGDEADSVYMDELFRGGDQDIMNSRGSSRANLLNLPVVPRKLESGPITNRHEYIEMEIIKSLVASYFGVVTKNFCDMVPKAIMCLLVNYTKVNIQSELVRTLYREDSFSDLLKENGDVATRRKQASEMQVLLRRAMEIVNEVRDYTC